MLKRILTLSMIPANVDTGLLILRVGAFLGLFLKHGYEKIAGFGQMSAHFPSMFGIGSGPSLTMAMLGDAICTLLIVFGFATRLAALYEFLIVFVAWAVVHHFQFFGKGADHGELIWLYLVALLAILAAGPGRYSVDHALDNTSV